MHLEKDKLYICFHKPKSIIGFLISLRTLGKYSHCEFIYNDYVYLSNPGGVRIIWIFLNWIATLKFQLC